MKILKAICLGIKFLVSWVCKSSKNPSAISLTLKAGAPLFILMGVDSALIDSTTNGIVETIVNVGELITGAITVYGVARKVIISIVQIVKIVSSKIFGE